MYADVEKYLRLLQPENMLKKHQMTGTADGKKFGQSLNNAQYDCLNGVHISFLCLIRSKREKCIIKIADYNGFREGRSI